MEKREIEFRKSFSFYLQIHGRINQKIITDLLEELSPIDWLQALLKFHLTFFCCKRRKRWISWIVQEKSDLSTSEKTPQKSLWFVALSLSSRR